MKRKLLLTTALALTLGTSSCLGPNKTFNDLHTWNEGFSENEWANEAVFIGLNIIPVYPIAYLVDILVFNSIVFWSGEEN